MKDIFTEIPKELKNKNILAIPWDSGFIEFKGTLQKVCKTIITVNDVIAELEKQIENCAACYSYYHKYQLYKELFDLSLQLLAKQEDIQQNIQKNAIFRNRKRECLKKLSFLEKMKNLLFAESQREKEFKYYAKWNILHNLNINKDLEKWFAVEKL